MQIFTYKRANSAQIDRAGRQSQSPTLPDSHCMVDHILQTIGAVSLLVMMMLADQGFGLSVVV